MVELLTIDVIHDLAILRVDSLQGRFLELNTAELDKGGRIYSMGNPRDLGLTIIEGTYNGLVKNSRYQKILFSGSLNPGMSGGPSIDENGEVIGVNVSTGGEQISFLVPAKNLRALLQQTMEAPADTDYTATITEALLADQDKFYRSLLTEPFTLEPYGELSLPSQMSDSLKCWGHTMDNDEEDAHNLIN